MPWYRRLGRGVGVLALLLYACVLFLGALPERMIGHEGLRDAGKSVRKAYWKLRVQPGAAVFDGHAKVDWAVHRWCLLAFAEDTRGETELMYATTENCQLPKVRLVTDVEALALYSTLGRNTAARLVTKKKHFRNVASIRRSKGVTTISRYFCERAPEETEGVILVAFTEGVRYGNGKKRATFDIIGSRSCDRPQRPRQIHHIGKWNGEGEPFLREATPGQIRKRERRLRRARGWK